MIADLVIGTILGVLGAVLGALPDLSLDGLSASGGMILYYPTLNEALPFGEMTLVLGASLLFRAWAAAWHTAIFLYRLIPFI